MITGVPSRLRPPWPASTNPLADQHARAARRDAVALRLLSEDGGHAECVRFEGFVAIDAHVYPRSPLDLLRAAGGFNQWLYFLDDQYDDDESLARDLPQVERLMSRALDVFRKRIDPITPFERFTALVRDRLAEHASDAWQSRFIAHVESYLFRGSLVTLERWAAGSEFTLEEYERVRAYDSAVFPAVDCAFVAAGLGCRGIPADPTLEAMVEVAVKHVAFVNDVFSYHKEVVRNRRANNLLHVIMMSERVSLERAVERALMIIEVLVARFEELEVLLHRIHQGTLDDLVAPMKDWMTGNVAFSLVSPRFRAPENFLPELRSPTTRAQPEAS